MLQGKNPELLAYAKAQERLNDLAKVGPQRKDPGGATSSAQPFTATAGALCAATQPRHRHMPRFTRSPWLRSAKRLPEGQRTRCGMNGTIDRAQSADQIGVTR